MPRLLRPILGALVSFVGGCTLLVSLDGLSGGEAGGSVEAGSGQETGPIADAGDAALIDADAGRADSGTAYGNAVLGDDPRAYWRLAEASGNEARDEVGNQHPGQYYGTFTLGAPGRLPGERAVALAGSGCIFVGAGFRYPAGATFSVEAWVKVSVHASTVRIATTEGFPTGNRNGWNLVINSGFPILEGWRYSSVDGGTNEFVLGAYSNTSLGGPMPLDTWNHLVGTYEPSAEQIWVNGVLRNRGSQSDLTLADLGELTLGCAGSGPASKLLSAPLKGSLADVAIYDAILTEAQITAHFRLGRGI